MLKHGACFCCISENVILWFIYFLEHNVLNLAVCYVSEQNFGDLRRF